MKNLKDCPLKSKTRHLFMHTVHLICLLIAITVLFPSLTSAAMSDYCLVPPYVKRDIKPNVLIIMDNSTIMGTWAYSKVTNLTCTVNTGTYKTSYFTTHEYFGLFKPNVQYAYSSNQWVPTSSPGVSGNFLNWLTTSQYDLVQSILVGGKSSSRITNINTLQSIGAVWNVTLTYTDSASATRECVFKINNGNIEITEATANACGYLDTPVKPIPNDPTTPFIISSIKPINRFAKNTGDETKQSLIAEVIQSSAKKVLGLFSSIMDILASDAEAAPADPLTITAQGGTVDIPPTSECKGGYTYTISASGGTGTGYAWSIAGTTPGTMGCAAGQYPVSSTVNTGLCLDPSGTPSTTLVGSAIYADIAGTYTFTVHVVDSKGEINKHNDSKDFRIVISNATVTIITDDPMPAGTNGAWYREHVIATGDCILDTAATATTWTETASTLPGTLTFPSNPSPFHYDQKDVTGTPNTTGSYVFTANVTDIAGNTASKVLHLTINPTPGSFQITTPSPLTDGTKGLDYQATISTVGFTCGSACSGWTWSITSGALPPGLSINTAGACLNGDHVYITGTPTATGDFSFTAQAITPGGCGGTATKTFTLHIGLKPPTIRTSGNLPIKICAGNATVNCNTPGARTTITYNTQLASTGSGEPCSASYPDDCVMKTGIIDEFWTQARYGVMDFNKQAGNAIPNMSKCIVDNPGASPDPDFLTAIENATPIDPITTLVNGAYEAIYYYQNDTTNNCDPFRNSQACLKNFILMLSAGVGANNPQDYETTTPSVFDDATNCPSANFANLGRNTCYGYNNDLRTAAGKQNVNTYIVNTMGTLAASTYTDRSVNPGTNTGSMLYQAADKAGGIYYEVIDPSLLREQLIQAFKDILKRAASGTAASVLASGEGSGANLIQAVFYPRRKFDNKEVSWIGRLTNLWYYVDPFFATSSIFEDNASTKKLNLTDDYKITLNYDSTLEKTVAKRYTDPDGDGTFVPVAAPNFQIEFEKLNSLWEAGLELWKRDVTVASTKRKIYTTLNGTSLLAGNFSADTNDNGSNTSNVDADNSSALLPYLNLIAGEDDFNTSGGVDEADARILIRYANGEDFSGLRDRTVKVDLNGDDDFADTNVYGYNETIPRVWKLGDILNATPKISSWAPLNLYHKTYKDATYQSFLNSSTYQSRGMVFAGGNDGMLHAFKLGTLDVTGPTITGATKAALCTDSNGDRLCTQSEINATTGLGKEEWAFIPKNVLPYLKYMTKTDYCHIYSVDLTPYVFDASIGSAADAEDAACTASEYWKCSKVKVDGTPLTDPTKRWRTVLIGGMRYGGACRNFGTACADVSGDGAKDCVNTPVANNGYSSYFALDVTDQEHPTLLWEFSNDQLGFSTAGPAVVKINARKLDASGTVSVPYQANTRNDRWFVVLASGPTGPIDTDPSAQQFMGRSDQNLRLFILDLKTGSLVRTIDTGISNAFAGSILNSTVDTDYDAQDNVMYIPYVQRKGLIAPYTWTNGGVLRLVTKEDLIGTDVDTVTGACGANSTALNPDCWAESTVIADAGPVTSSVVNLQNTAKGQLWIYFSSGRYYYEKSGTIDDADGRRQIFGYKEPCYSTATAGFDPTCSTSITFCSDPVNSTTCGGLTNVTDIANVPANPDLPSFHGWYINLDGTDSIYKAERSISNPFAIVSGTAFFSTYKPYADECAFAGVTYLWALKYNTGGAPGAIQGVVLLQSSTGSIEQINLQDTATLAEKDHRRTASVEGKPPEGDPPPLLSSPPAVKRVIHMRER